MVLISLIDCACESFYGIGSDCHSLVFKIWGSKKAGAETAPAGGMCNSA